MSPHQPRRLSLKVGVLHLLEVDLATGSLEVNIDEIGTTAVPVLCVGLFDDSYHFSWIDQLVFVELIPPHRSLNLLGLELKGYLPDGIAHLHQIQLEIHDSFVSGC